MSDEDATNAKPKPTATTTATVKPEPTTTTTTPEPEDTWQRRIRTALRDRGYENCMRRSLQTVILYESKRCLTEAFLTMRPFQRKAAFLDQCLALLELLEQEQLLHPHQAAEILWRTASSREQMDAEIAWKRIKGIEKELDSLAQRVQPFCTPDRTHNEAVDALVQDMYEQLGSGTGKHVNWEHAHNHCLLTYRVYYVKTALDPTFPKAVSPRAVVIPKDRPGAAAAAAVGATTQVKKRPVGRPPKSATSAAAMAAAAVAPLTRAAAATTTTTAPPQQPEAAHTRMTLLNEVRQHLDLLKEFEGVISSEDLAKRKRELFESLPSAPPPGDVKRIKREDA